MKRSVKKGTATADGDDCQQPASVCLNCSDRKKRKNLTCDTNDNEKKIHEPNFNRQKSFFYKNNHKQKSDDLFVYSNLRTSKTTILWSIEVKEKIQAAICQLFAVQIVNYDDDKCTYHY